MSLAYSIRSIFEAPVGDTSPPATYPKLVGLNDPATAAVLSTSAGPIGTNPFALALAAACVALIEVNDPLGDAVAVSLE